MANLASLLEDYRNWRGRQDWEQGKGWQDFFGGDPRAQEQFEKLSGFGTDAGGLVGMIKASHGSPHMFDRFDFTKIGTGEGAQAYGHGGYFAQGFDSPVAKEYRDALSGVEVGGKVLKPDWDDPNYYPLQALRKHGDDIEKARQDVYERNARIPGGWPEELDAFESLAKQGVQRNQGHLYNVELKWPDAAREAADPLGEHHLFEWHTPLDELSAKDAEIINPILKKLNDGPNPSLFSDVKTAGDVVRYAQALGMNPANEISKAGYPGIKYLDAGSRGVGTGSRNYVIFDDAIPSIVTRNGEPTGLAGMVR